MTTRRPDRVLSWLVSASVVALLAAAVTSVPRAEGERDGGPLDAAPPVVTGVIELAVTGLASDRGQVCASLYNRPDGYPREPEKALLRQCAAIVEKRSAIVFEDLPHGTYAAFAFHDVDGDGAIKTSRLGIPREPIGASNDARGRFGPPSFEDASFQLDAPRTVIPIEVRSL